MSSTALLVLPVERSDVLLLSVSIWREVDSAKPEHSKWGLIPSTFLPMLVLQNRRSLHANTFSSRTAIYLDRDKAQN